MLRGICIIELEGKNEIEGSKLLSGVNLIDEALKSAKEQAGLKDGVLEKITTIMHLAHKIEYLQTLERKKLREEGMTKTVKALKGTLKKLIKIYASSKNVPIADQKVMFNKILELC